MVFFVEDDSGKRSGDPFKQRWPAFAAQRFIAQEVRIRNQDDRAIPHLPFDDHRLVIAAVEHLPLRFQVFEIHGAMPGKRGFQTERQGFVSGFGGQVKFARSRIAADGEVCPPVLEHFRKGNTTGHRDLKTGHRRLIHIGVFRGRCRDPGGRSRIGRWRLRRFRWRGFRGVGRSWHCSRRWRWWRRWCGGKRSVVRPPAPVFRCEGIDEVGTVDEHRLRMRRLLFTPARRSRNARIDHGHGFRRRMLLERSIVALDLEPAEFREGIKQTLGAEWIGAQRRIRRVNVAPLVAQVHQTRNAGNEPKNGRYDAGDD